MSDTTAPASAAPEPAPAPASPTFASLFSQVLTKLEAAVPSVAGLEALWAAHQARGHSYDDERKKLAEMHEAIGTSDTKTASASAPGASAPSVTATATASAKPEGAPPPKPHTFAAPKPDTMGSEPSALPASPTTGFASATHSSSEE